MKTILITGASTGIGKDVALHFVNLGWNVFAGVRKTTDAEMLKRENSKINTLILDVTDDQQVESAFGEIENTSGRLDALVNNAGISSAGPIEALELEKWRNVFEVNLFGVVKMTQKFLPLLRESKGRIVNISSISGLIASPFVSVYAASKFALEAFSDSLRREVKGQGVHVAIIEPGPIKTEIWQKGLKESEESLLNYPEEILKVYGNDIQKFKSVVVDSAEGALPVERVTEKINHAVTSSHPKTRYLVHGKDTFVKILKHLPDGLVDRAILKMR